MAMASDEPGAEATSNLLGSEVDEDYSDQEHRSRATSSVDHDSHSEESVNLLYLFALTCGVAG